MEVLKPERYCALQPLIEQSEIKSHLLLARSFLEGNQGGVVFADNSDAPRTALVCPDDGFYFPFGDAAHPSFEAFLPELLAHHLVEKPALYATSAAWKDTLDRLFATRVSRYGFEYRPAECLMSPDWREQVPPGFTLEPMDETVGEKWQEGIDPWIIQIWGGPEAFAARSFGYAILHEGKIASFCAVGCREACNAEIEVGTVPRYRSQGLAALAAMAFIEECQKRGLVPAWTCDSRNVASQKLARKLGFIQNEEVYGYPLDADYALNDGVWGPSA